MLKFVYFNVCWYVDRTVMRVSSQLALRWVCDVH